MRQGCSVTGQKEARIVRRRTGVATARPSASVRQRTMAYEHPRSREVWRSVRWSIRAPSTPNTPNLRSSCAQAGRSLGRDEIKKKPGGLSSGLQMVKLVLDRISSNPGRRLQSCCGRRFCRWPGSDSSRPCLPARLCAPLPCTGPAWLPPQRFRPCRWRR